MTQPLDLSGTVATSPRRMLLGRTGYGMALGLPTLLTLCTDAWVRPERLALFGAHEWLRYGASVIVSLCFWMSLLHGAVRATPWWRRMYAVVFLVSFTLAWGGQQYFFQQYHAYINRHLAQYATDFTDSVVNQISADLANYLRFKLPALGLGLTLLWLARLSWLARRSWVRVRQSGSSRSQHAPLAGSHHLIAGGACLLGLFFPNQSTQKQASMPDMLYVEALGEMHKTQLGLGQHSHQKRPGLRHSLQVPSLRPLPARPRNVVLVVLESVRKDATCTSYDANCRETPYTNALFPHRVPLPQLRALDSCTIVSMGVLYAGVAPNASRQVLHQWPLLFDYARAAGYTTALLTSQNLMFGNMALWLKHLDVDHLLSGLDVDPESDVDLGAPERRFTRQAIPIVEQLREPYLLVIQLSNGHYPYLVEPDGPRPFQPATTSKAPRHNRAFFNHYKNAVHQQDLHLAQLLDSLRRSAQGERAVIVYTSDHGEAFREHDQMGHTFSLYDEELLVPGFIDAPVGTLSPEEEQRLRANAPTFLTHPDLTATVLDLLGVWDLPQLLPFRSHIIGRSLLRPVTEHTIFPLTNCTEIWSCAFENWGALQANRKLQAREWDSDYRCFDLEADPEERHDLGPQACLPLKQAAEGWFKHLPGRHRQAD